MGQAREESQLIDAVIRNVTPSIAVEIPSQGQRILLRLHYWAQVQAHYDKNWEAG